MQALLLRSVLALFVVSTAVRAEDNWPQFRGRESLGVAEDPRLPDEWSQTKNVVWKTPIPGRGWSSPITWGDRIFLTSVSREGTYEAAKKGLYFGGERLKAPEEVHHWLVYCLDFKTGKILWEREAHKGPPQGSIHIKNSYASETPVTDGERVYAYFGNQGLYCYDLAGKLLWSRQWLAYKTRFGWGTAASPVLFDDRLLIVNDNEEKSFLVALDKRTGSELWKVDRDEKSNWATPFVWKNDLRTEIITPGSNKVRSYDKDGKLLWELGGMSTISIPMPFTQHGLLYVTSGYVLDRKKPVFAIKPGAKGDISLKEDETSNEFIAWSQKMAGPYNPSPLIYGDYFYVLYDRGFFACFDARTGKKLYDKERLGSTEFTASPWAYNGKIFCLSEDGDTFVLQAGPEFKILGRNKLDELSLATPALAQGSLLIRTEGHLYRLQKK